MDLLAVIAAREASLAGITARRDALGAEATAILATVEAETRTALTDEENTRHLDLISQRATLDTEITEAAAAITALRGEVDSAARDAAALEQRTPVTDPPASGVRVTSEPRTYMRENDKSGQMFLRDVALAGVFNNGAAQARLMRHMEEEIVVRETAGQPLVERATGQVVTRSVGTGAFTGLVVPQYLTSDFATYARAGRPLADASRHHDLPPQGMNAYIGKLTTGTTVTDQANEGDTASETDADDTLLTIPIRTASGSQSVSRQAVERGVGIDDTLTQDLFSAYGKNLDSNLINQASTGLTNLATSIAYTDASPTGAELYPKLLQGPAQAEAALMDADPGDTICVMHSRRWYWLNSQLTSTWPLLGQPGASEQTAGVNLGAKYGPGFRGLLPSGIPVIVDNNIATNYGVATNEDEIYFVAQSESHLWEDPNAPLLIRAEQTQSKKLLIDLVVYGYYAYTFNRRAHAQKIGGTGLVVPAWT